MRKTHFTLLPAVVLGFACTALAATTPKFSALYVFGDSYCDVGNVYLATGGAKPVFPYYDGRFSDGPIWVDHIAGYLGVPLTPALAGGTDWAFGGAWVTAPQNGVPTVPQQVEMYLQSTGGKADPNALYFLDGGGNDVVQTTTGDPNALGYQIAAGLADSERMLRQAGARHFVIPNLFNVGLLPVAADHVAFAAAASSAANSWLAKLLENEQRLPHVQLLEPDINSMMNAVQKSQTHFGFLNVTAPCLVTDPTPSLCSDPDRNFFWDVYHPTVFGHAFLAVLIENALANPDDRAPTPDRR